MDLMHLLHESDTATIIPAIIYLLGYIFAILLIFYLINRTLKNRKYSRKNEEVQCEEEITNLSYKYHVVYNKYALILTIFLFEVLSSLLFFIGTLIGHITQNYTIIEDIPQNCSNFRLRNNLWNEEFSSYLIAILYGAGNLAIINTFAFSIVLLVYLIKVYKRDLNYKCIKIFLAITELMVVSILILVIFKQTLLFTKILIPLMEIVYISLHVFYTKRMISVLEWRCIDAWHCTHDKMVVRKQKYILRNFKILSTITISAYTALVTLNILQQLMTFIAIFFTYDSYIFMVAFNLNVKPIVIDCNIQRIFFVVLTVMEASTFYLIFLSILLVLIPTLCIFAVFCIISTCKNCVGKFSPQTRFTPEMTESLIANFRNRY